MAIAPPPPRPVSNDDLEALIREARARQRRRWITAAAVLGLAAGIGIALLAAAGSGSAVHVRGHGPISVVAGHVSASTAASCPVTLPNQPRANSAVSKKFGYRQGQLGVELWPLGVTLVDKRDVEANGTLGVKVGWYRYGRGKLTLTATRLDKPGRVKRTEATSGYGLTGFQSSAVNFPGAGCWRVTATVGHSHLSYVTVILVVQALRGRVIE